MPTVNEVYNAIGEIAPFDTAEPWDNSGILVNCGGDISAVLVALDITNEVVSEAAAEGCGLIVAHHPVIFKPMRKLAHGDVVYRLARKGISAVCAHTNLDAAAGGVNDILAAIFGVVDAQVFANVGRVGELKKPTTTAELAADCAKRFGSQVRFADAGRPINRLAVLGGSGGGLLDEAIAAGADCILTGEADHHDAIDAKHAGVSLVVAGHFSTEFPLVPVLADWLGKRFPQMRVQASRRDKDPFSYVSP